MALRRPTVRSRSAPRNATARSRLRFQAPRSRRRAARSNPVGWFRSGSLSMRKLPDDYDVSLSVDVGLLVPLLKVIDQQIEKVEARFATNPSDGDTFGWFDDREALAGLGFVACQQLLNAAYRPGKPVRATGPGRKGGVIARERQDLRRQAMQKGPQHSSGVP